MALKGIFSYNGLDNTNDLNALNSRIIDRGIFDGGELILSGIALQASIPPFVAVGYDGMVVINDATITATIPANTTSYLVCLAKWLSGSQPVIDIQVIPEVTWLTSINKNYYITFAKFVVPFGAMTLLPTYADWSVSDYADKAGKTGWRPSAANFAALPTSGNKQNDVRMAAQKLYYWDQSTKTWKVLTGSAIDISCTPYGGIVSTNIQGALQNLEDNKVPYATDAQTKVIPFVHTGTSGQANAFFNIPFSPPYFVTIPTAIIGPDGSGSVIAGASVAVAAAAALEITTTGLTLVVAIDPIGSFMANFTIIVTVP